MLHNGKESFYNWSLTFNGRISLFASYTWTSSVVKTEIDISLIQKIYKENLVLIVITNSIVILALNNEFNEWNLSNRNILWIRNKSFISEKNPYIFKKKIKMLYPIFWRINKRYEEYYTTAFYCDLISSN